MDISVVIAAAKEKAFDLAFDISKRIDPDKEWDSQVQAGQLLSLIRVLENPNTLLTSVEQQQLAQGLISIGELTI